MKVNSGDKWFIFGAGGNGNGQCFENDLPLCKMRKYKNFIAARGCYYDIKMNADEILNANHVDEQVSRCHWVYQVAENFTTTFYEIS